MSGGEVRPATIADREAVVRALVRAFDADPAMNYVLRKDGRRGRAFEDIFDIAFCRLTAPFGETWIAGDGHGAALWTPPSRWSSARALTRPFSLIGCVGFGRVPRVLGMLDRIQKGHPSVPHYYLLAIGVDPSQQGRGVGSALLSTTLARVDAAGAPAYLEASTEANSRLYARHGFEVVETVRMAEDAPPIWLMWREAKPRG